MTSIMTVSRRQKIIVAITILMIICAFLLNIYQKEPLFIMGVQFSLALQNRFKHQLTIVIIQNLISLLCNPGFAVVIVAIYFYLVKRKLNGMVYSGHAIIVIFIIAVMKQWFQQSRPFWYSKQVQILQWTCPKDFGNPSGHSVATFLVYFPLVANYFGFGLYQQGWIYLIFIGITVPLSRVFLGAHSLNQVVFGLFIGISSIVLYKFLVQKFFYRLYWNLLMKPIRIPLVIGIILLNLGCFAFQIIIYGINRQKYPFNKVDLQNLNNGCDVYNDSLYYQRKALQSCSVIQIFFGFLYGLIALQPDDKYYLLGMFSFTNKYKASLYYLLCLLCVFIPIGTAILLAFLLPIAGIATYSVLSAGLILVGFIGCWGWIRLLRLYNISHLQKPDEIQKISRGYRPVQIQLK